MMPTEIWISHDSAVLLDSGGGRVCSPDGLASASASPGRHQLVGAPL